MTTPEAEAPAAEEVLTYEQEMDAIRARLTQKQMAWLAQLPKSNYQFYAAGKALQLSDETVWRWLQQKDIQRYRELLKERAAETIDFNEMSLLTAWKRDADSDFRKFFDDNGNVKVPKDWPEELVHCVQEYGTNSAGERFIKFVDRRGAQDRLAKYLKMLPDRHEVTGTDGGPLHAMAPTIIIGGPGEPGEPGVAPPPH